MWKYLQILFGIILTSFYFFPFTFTFLPTVNTKMALAVIGLVMLGLQLGRSQSARFNKDIVTISACAMIMSFASFIAITLNETRDYGYVWYFISMWVWLSAAYVAVSYIRMVHGYVSVDLVCNYLIAVCVFQCVSALIIDIVPVVQEAVIQTISGLGTTEMALMENSGRLFGFGAALDPAGSRFAAVLVITSFVVLNKAKAIHNNHLMWYVLAFLFIAVIGNMIARTTIVGVIIGFAYILCSLNLHKFSFDKSSWHIVMLFIGVLVVAVPAIVILYNKNEAFHDHIRFAFEGFFSLVEKGRWEVRSNDILKNMIVFPDTLKTWLIGDGYIVDPTGVDPYYTGPSFQGYYMQTDIGYLRFLFYGGLPCVLAMIFVIWQAGRICMKKHMNYRAMFWLLMIVNYVVWLKGATDIFLVFALFLIMGKEECAEYELKG